MIPVRGIISFVIFFDGVPIGTPQGAAAYAADETEEQENDKAVSYTHLTLPTKA